MAADELSDALPQRVPGVLAENQLRKMAPVQRRKELPKRTDLMSRVTTHDELRSLLFGRRSGTTR